MARASRLNPSVTSRLFAELRGGSDIRAACRAAGVARSTVYAWNDAGEQGREPFVSFRRLFLEATAEGAKALVAAAIAALETADLPLTA